MKGGLFLFLYIARLLRVLDCGRCIELEPFRTAAAANFVTRRSDRRLLLRQQKRADKTKPPPQQNKGHHFGEKHMNLKTILLQKKWAYVEPKTVAMHASNHFLRVSAVNRILILLCRSFSRAEKHSLLHHKKILQTNSHKCVCRRRCSFWKRACDPKSVPAPVLHQPDRPAKEGPHTKKGMFVFRWSRKDESWVASILSDVWIGWCVSAALAVRCGEIVWWSVDFAVGRCTRVPEKERTLADRATMASLHATQQKQPLWHLVFTTISMEGGSGALPWRECKRCCFGRTVLRWMLIGAVGCVVAEIGWPFQQVLITTVWTMLGMSRSFAASDPRVGFDLHFQNSARAWNPLKHAANGWAHWQLSNATVFSANYSKRHRVRNARAPRAIGERVLTLFRTKKLFSENVLLFFCDSRFFFFHRQFFSLVHFWRVWSRYFSVWFYFFWGAQDLSLTKTFCCSFLCVLQWIWPLLKNVNVGGFQHCSQSTHTTNTVVNTKTTPTTSGQHREKTIKLADASMYKTMFLTIMLPVWLMLMYCWCFLRWFRPGGAGAPQVVLVLPWWCCHFFNSQCSTSSTSSSPII